MVEADKVAVTEAEHAGIERQSLEIGKWGSLLMAVAGVVAAVLSRSDALLVDGLWEELDAALRDMLGSANTEIIIAAKPPYKS